MKATKMLISTLKEAPNEATISSHILLLRAGMIKTNVSGVYNYLPFGLKVLNKIEKIVREEMDKSGAQEILCSAIQPKELWEESGRWSKYGPELFRFNDRHDREFCLGPTHEEIFTDLARNLIKSRKDLPMNLYQIQTKYRDEVRPRFGLMRGREFVMKDAYSFDLDQSGLDESYKQMYEVYSKIFDRLNINYKVVLADSGNIGGSGSHQFMALSEIGESDIAYCPHCDFAADTEASPALPVFEESNEELLSKEKVSTPNVKSIDEVCEFFNVDKKKTIKSVLYKDEEQDELVLVLVRGDREVNDIKVKNALNTSEVFLHLANDADIAAAKTFAGSMGPIGVNAKVICDAEVPHIINGICGSNENGYHFKNVNFNVDYKAEVFDLRNTVEGDICPVCGAPLKIDRGIEVGQIFKLQTKYSEPMKCMYTDELGKQQPMYMGCYGIGVTRTLQAIVEQHHDDYGIVWPKNITPYQAVVMPINSKDEAQNNLALSIHDSLVSSSIETILDDRKAKPGFKFKDWDLIGIPYLIICGKKSSENIVELKNRETQEKQEMPFEEAIKVVTQAYKNI